MTNDPIVAAIEAQRSAQAEVERLSALVDASIDADGGVWDRLSGAMEAEDEAMQLVCATTPTTRAGAQALARFIRERLLDQELRTGDLQPDRLLEAVGSIEQFLGAGGIARAA